MFYDKFYIAATTHPAEGAQVFHFIPKSLKSFIKQMHRPQDQRNSDILLRNVHFSLILQNSLRFQTFDETTSDPSLNIYQTLHSLPY